MILFEALDALVVGHLQGPSLAWWSATTRGDTDRIKFLGAFSGAARRLGRDEVEATVRPDPIVEQHGLTLDQLTWARLGRIALLLSLPGRFDEGEILSLVTEAYRTGDLQEKQAVLRALAFLPQPTVFLPVAAEGARSNALAIFEAIACENHYPARHFSQDAFNQLAMKALFNEVSLSRVVGLGARMNAGLTRMARDYALERRAAGRLISDDLCTLEQGTESR